MWGQPPFDRLRAGSRLSRHSCPERSRRSAARRTRRCFLPLAVICALIFSAAMLPASAATWTVHAQPTRLVNGAPVLFQVKPPTKLDSLTGRWLGHTVTFSYDASTKTWFALAGVTFETAPGKYPLELTGEAAVENSLDLHPHLRCRPRQISQDQSGTHRRKEIHRAQPRAAGTNCRRRRKSSRTISAASLPTASGTANSPHPPTPRSPTSSVHSASSTARRSASTRDSISASPPEPRSRP